jgi:hypothetical protein
MLMLNREIISNAYWPSKLRFHQPRIGYLGKIQRLFWTQNNDTISPMFYFRN